MVIQISSSSVQVSLSRVKRIERVCTAQIETFPLSSIKGFVTVANDGCCWLGCAIKVDTEAQFVEINFLHPPLPARSCVHPQHQDVLKVDPSDILILVSPSTATGHTYSLTSKEVAAAT